jgi:ABC-type Na+ efflux pump permease subunit
MNRFFAMVRRELKSVTKEKTIMLAILIQLIIASFSSVIVTGLMAFYDPDSIGQSTKMTVTAGVVDQTDGPLVGILREESLRVKLLPDAASAESAFRTGLVDTVILVPEKAGNVVNMKLMLPELDSKATVVMMVLKEPLKQYESYLREQNGIAMQYTDLSARTDTSYEFLYSLILPILMFFPALLAGSIVIDTVSEEIENKTLDTLRSAPVSLNQILGAKVCAAIITVLVQCTAWSLLLRLNHLHIENLGLVLLLSVTVGTIVSVGAATASLYFKDRERAQFAYSMVLVVMVGLSYLVSPSPFSLMARLATGSHYTGTLDVLLYMVPLVVLGAAFLRWSGKLLATQSVR